jgi:hypothetical protein
LVLAHQAVHVPLKFPQELCHSWYWLDKTWHLELLTWNIGQLLSKADLEW